MVSSDYHTITSGFPVCLAKPRQCQRVRLCLIAWTAWLGAFRNIIRGNNIAAEDTITLFFHPFGDDLGCRWPKIDSQPLPTKTLRKWWRSPRRDLALSHRRSKMS